MTSTTTIRCERCGEALTPEALERGWPISVAALDAEDPAQDDESICPSCYGDDAFCGEGHVLRADSDAGVCAVPGCPHGPGYTVEDLVLCESADGWSLHAPGSTDEQIAEGDALPLLSGEGGPTEADWDEAWARYTGPSGA